MIVCYCHFKAYYRQLTYLLELCAYSSANLAQVFISYSVKQYVQIDLHINVLFHF